MYWDEVAAAQLQKLADAGVSGVEAADPHLVFQKLLHGRDGEVQLALRDCRDGESRKVFVTAHLRRGKAPPEWRLTDVSGTILDEGRGVGDGTLPHDYGAHSLVGEMRKKFYSLLVEGPSLAPTTALPPAASAPSTPPPSTPLPPTPAAMPPPASLASTLPNSGGSSTSIGVEDSKGRPLFVGDMAKHDFLGECVIKGTVPLQHGEGVNVSIEWVLDPVKDKPLSVGGRHLTVREGGAHENEEAVNWDLVPTPGRTSPAPPRMPPAPPTAGVAAAAHAATATPTATEPDGAAPAPAVRAAGQPVACRCVPDVSAVCAAGGWCAAVGRRVARGRSLGTGLACPTPNIHACNKLGGGRRTSPP